MSLMPWDQRLARIVVRPIARLPVHPNALTTAGLLVGLTAAALMASGNPAHADLGAALFMLAVFMDHTDGELARQTGKTSTFGHYYDHVAALTTYVALFVGVGIGLGGGEGGDGGDGTLVAWAPIMGVLAGLGVATAFGGRVYLEERLGKQAVQQDSFAGFEMEDTLYIVGPVTWLGGLTPFLVAAAVGAPVFALFVLWQIRRSHQVSVGPGA